MPCGGSKNQLTINLNRLKDLGRDFMEQRHHKKSKFNIYETMIKSVLLYGHKIWRIIEKSKRALKATEMDIIRQPIKIS